MLKPPKADIREVLLAEIRNQEPKSSTDSTLQQGPVLEAVARKLNAINNRDLEQALLTQWQELFRTGLLAWGLNISNPSAPHFHVTDRGRQALEKLTRDPGNPAGYLRHLASIATLNPVAQSYLAEGLECYVAGLYKAAAVMVGGATESVILDLRDVTVQKLTLLGKPITKDMDDWKLKTLTDGLHSFLDGRKAQFGRELREAFEAYWSAFAQQIRAIRNDAGHPTSVEPVTPDTIHASLLIFPELTRLANSLANWVANDLQ